MRARDIAERVNAGSLDAVAVTRDALARCKEAQARYNALTVIHDAKALAAAEALSRHKGEALPLAGVPLVVKDNIWVGGWRITQGSRYFADFVAPRDATAVARLREAGAVILAIGTCSEFAAKGNTTTPLHGDTLNPLDPRLTAGGSSGGCSAIVAAGAVPIALGTDGGGSSRRPPSHCGLVGFKPSYGAVPHPHGFAEPFWGLSALSPITRDVADAALMFEVIAGPDPLDPDSRHLAPRRDEPVAGLRIAQHPTLGLDVPVDADVAAAYEAAVDALMTAGLMIADAAPDWPSAEERASLSASQFAGLASMHGEAWRRNPDWMDPALAAQVEAGFALPATRLAEALETSQRIRRAAAAFFTEHDLMLSPTTACVAWPVGQLGPPMIGGKPVDPRGHAVFTPLWNHGQNPAISIPCGRGRDGLPVGLQIAGAVGEDRRVLAFARLAEQILADAGLWEAAP